MMRLDGFQSGGFALTRRHSWGVLPCWIVVYSRCHNKPWRVKLTNLPRGVDSCFLHGCPGGCNAHRSPNSARWKQLFTLLDFRPENQILVMTVSTISVHQHRPIPFPAAPGRRRLFCFCTFGSLPFPGLCSQPHIKI